MRMRYQHRSDITRALKLKKALALQPVTEEAAVTS